MSDRICSATDEKSRIVFLFKGTDSCPIDPGHKSSWLKRPLDKYFRAMCLVRTENVRFSSAILNDLSLGSSQGVKCSLIPTGAV